MKVKWRQGIAGRVHGQSVRRGGVTEVPDEEGARYCELGYCEPVAQDRTEDIETAVLESTEETRAAKDAEEKPAGEETAVPAKPRRQSKPKADG